MANCSTMNVVDTRVSLLKSFLGSGTLTTNGRADSFGRRHENELLERNTEIGGVIKYAFISLFLGIQFFCFRIHILLLYWR